MALNTRQKAVLLRDDSVGVSTESEPRNVQFNQGNGQSSSVTVNSDWLRQLNLDEEENQTLHSVALGVKPVIVQNPAIIIQPAAVLGEEIDDE